MTTLNLRQLVLSATWRKTSKQTFQSSNSPKCHIYLKDTLCVFFQMYITQHHTAISLISGFNMPVHCSKIRITDFHLKNFTRFKLVLLFNHKFFFCRICYRIFKSNLFNRQRINFYTPCALACSFIKSDSSIMTCYYHITAQSFCSSI